MTGTTSPESAATVRVADLVADLLVEQGITDVFMVTGGGAMHLNDALGNHPGLKVHLCHHEQACAMAAESYARLTGRPAVVQVTTGPGGTNTITGIFGAWTDSVPVVVVSGQVKRETLVSATGLPLRQLGDQEVDIVSLVGPVTKRAVLLTDPAATTYELQRAVWTATTGRPGPVWLDIPSDVQAAKVGRAQLSFDATTDPDDSLPAAADLEAQVRDLLADIAAAERPVVLAGGGVRASGSYAAFLTFVERLGVPVTTGWNAHDLLWDDHVLYAGRPGTVGTRAGNFAVQNSDLLLVLGSRLNVRQVGYAFETWARGAAVTMVDVDAAELAKPTLHVERPVHADLVDFFAAAERALDAGAPTGEHSAWVQWCRDRVLRYQATTEATVGPERVNPYVFVDRLTRALPEDQVVVAGDGTACVVTFQAAVLKRGQRLFTNSGAASMGYDLPAAVGAAVALGPDKSVICLAGDGSLMMNLQELATIRGNHLDVTVFVLNNEGYHSIRQTQNNYFPGREVGCGRASGLWFPRFEALAAAFDLPFTRIADGADLDAVLPEVLARRGPQLVEVLLDLDQQFSPKAASRVLPDGRMVSAPLEDLAPFLTRDELASNMLIPVLAT